MTDAEREVARSLTGCRMVPGSWEKRFARDLAGRAAGADPRPLSEKQRAFLWRLAHRYRRQIFRDGQHLTAVQVRQHFERRYGGMTEQEWLASADPAPMLRFLGPRASARKLRLFACACCRQVWHLLTDPRSRAAVEVAERFADGLATVEEYHDAWQEAWQAGHKPVTTFPASVVPWLFGQHDAPGGIAGQVGYLLREAVSPAAQAALLRDLFSNPFRPTPPVRFTETARRFAESVYDRRDFESLPILADMLEEQGGGPAEVLVHLRDPGPHARGCWALDAILGKS